MTFLNKDLAKYILYLSTKRSQFLKKISNIFKKTYKNIFSEDIKIDILRRAIIDEIAELDRLRGQERDSRAPVERDQQSIGRFSRLDAMQRQAMNIANDARRQYCQLVLSAVWKRIDDVDYDYCHQCDDLIGAGRLAIDPAAVLCVGCA